MSWWEKKKGEANEPLDLMGYNIAAAYLLGLHKKNESAWASLRARLVPQVMDLFQQPDEAMVTEGIANEATIDTDGPQAASVPGAVHTSAHVAAPLAATSSPPSSPSPVMSNGRITLKGLRRGAN